VPIALAVHGGAWNIPDALVEPSTRGIEAALRKGWEILRDGGTALDVVEIAVRHLEDDPHFDAGRGSHLNSAGRVELDASIMDGEHLAAGAVAAVERVRHPVSLARKVMERSSHVMLVGPGARAFAREVGEPLCRTPDLLVGRELALYRRVRRGDRRPVIHEFEPGPLGTVGAVALDRDGHVASATSTGGVQDKTPGRVGDTPVIGSGTFADDRLGAASCTGHGESILKAVLAKGAVDRLDGERPPASAARSALATLRRVDGLGGLILVDRQGRVATAFNTPRMARGVATERGGLRVAVDPRTGRA
jgi:beta-aspartyl-peptidase (threonine type)